MPICSFLGNNTLYDTKVNKRLVETIERIVKENDDVDFWLYRLSGGFLDGPDFFTACYDALMKVKNRHPDRNITITRIESDRDNAAFGTRYMSSPVPTCVAGRVIVPPDFPQKLGVRDVTAVSKKVQRWIIKQSDFIICYVYEDLNEPENQLLTSARASGAMLYDVTDPDTAAAIVESFDTLPDREQFIMRCKSGGQTLDEIAAQLGITQSAVQQSIKHACRSLIRLAKMRRQQEEKPVVCSIVALGKETANSIADFREAVYFLVKTRKITEFLILWEYSTGKYMRALEEVTRVHPSIRLVAITHFSEPENITEAKKREIRSVLCPPCHEVENIDTGAVRRRIQVLRASKALIDRADYCVCNLTGNPLEESLRKYMEKRNKPVILDISKGSVP